MRIAKVSLDAMPWRQQVEVARTSDVLVGMHGAGLTHLLWLPPHAAVVELLPNNFTYHFYERVARLAGVHYHYWQNEDPSVLHNCTWPPHTKFCNFILPADRLLPVLQTAVSGVRQRTLSHPSEL